MINASRRRSSSHLPFMSVWSFLPLMAVWSYKTILIEWSCKRNRFSAKSGNFPIVQMSNILTPQHSLLLMEGMEYACNLLLFVFQKPSWNHIGLLSFGYRLITWARSCNLPSRMPIKGTWGRKKKLLRSQDNGDWNYHFFEIINCIFCMPSPKFNLRRPGWETSRSGTFQ